MSPPTTWTPPPSTSYGMRSTRRRRETRHAGNTRRLVHMERMDEILMLEDGSIVERGTYEEPLKANSLYKRMVEVQNQMLTTSRAYSKR